MSIMYLAKRKTHPTTSSIERDPMRVSFRTNTETGKLLRLTKPGK